MVLYCLCLRAVACLKQVLKADGLPGFYQGVGSPLLGQMAFNACLFGTFNATKRAMLGASGASELSNLQIFAAGSMTGMASAIVETPVDLFKSKMQLQTLHQEAAALTPGGAARPDFHSTWGCVKFVTKNWGLCGWYQGLSSTILRNSVSNGSFFLSYEASKKWLMRRSHVQEATPAILLMSGALGGFACVSLSHPLDVIKSALMSDDLQKRKYHGIIDCANKVKAEHGFAGFSRGLLPSLVRAVTGNAVLVLTVEMVRRYLT